jgi:hypothetical protein
MSQVCDGRNRGCGPVRATHARKMLAASHCRTSLLPMAQYVTQSRYVLQPGRIGRKNIFTYSLVSRLFSSKMPFGQLGIVLIRIVVRTHGEAIEKL